MTNRAENGTYDVVGIGFGPANIALAIAAEELETDLSFKFIERNASPGWQEEMLLPESDIQNHPLRDLVTPRNPKSHYTFVNFLFENDRLFEHLNLPLQHPLRLEYRQYVTWVAGHFVGSVDYGCEADAVFPKLVDGRISGYEVALRSGHRIRARSVVVAPGRTPNVPTEFQGFTDPRVVHLTQFASAFEKLKRANPNPRIAVVGGSQTAVELLLHLAGNLPSASVHGINRNFGFRLKDTSPFSEEVYFPGFVNTFFHASREDKARLRRELVFTNYSSADRDVVDALYVQLYRNKIQGNKNLSLRHLTVVSGVTADEQGVHLSLTHTFKGLTEDVSVDLVVLATGFKDLGDGTLHEPYPSLLAPMAVHLDLDHGAMAVDINYRVRLKDDASAVHAPLFLNGLCESSHGMGDAGSFSLLGLRSEAILRSLEERLERSALSPPMSSGVRAASAHAKAIG